MRRVLLEDDDDPHLSLALPNELFSSQALHTIHLTAATSEAVTNLRVLNNLLSTCKLLEKIKLAWCAGLKNVKVQNLLRLTELDILSTEDDDLWEINNVPSLSSFRYRHIFASRKPIPFQLDSLASVTHLCIEGGFIFNKSFFHALERNFPVLESLTLVIKNPVLKDLVFTSASLKWLTLNIYPTGPVVNIQVYAPKLLSFIYTGRILGLLFQTAPPKQVELTFHSWEETLGHSYFLRIREALNSSSKFDIKIRSSNLDSLVRRLNIDVDDLRRRVFLFPVGNVELVLETCLDEHAWEQSRFFDALFLICHPSYIRSSYHVIRKMMEGNTTDQLKEVLLKNPHNGNWEALTTSWKSVLHTLTGDLECKLIWSAQ
ncbi:F-box protein-like protein [Tanacetum coccineum]